MIKGPKTYPRTYIDTTREATARLFSPNSSMTNGTPGANVDDAKGLYVRIRVNTPDGETSLPFRSSSEESYRERRRTYVKKVIEEIKAMLIHFLLAGQFNGFSGSSGPSQLTTFGSLVS